MTSAKPSNSKLGKSKVPKKISPQSKSSPPIVIKDQRKGMDEAVSLFGFEDEMILAAERLAEKEFREYQRKKSNLDAKNSKVFSHKAEPTTPYVLSKTEKGVKVRSERRLQLGSKNNLFKWQMVNMPHPFDTATSSALLHTQNRKMVTKKDNSLPVTLESADSKLVKKTKGDHINPSKKFGISDKKFKAEIKQPNTDKEEDRVLNDAHLSNNKVKEISTAKSPCTKRSAASTIQAKDVARFYGLDNKVKEAYKALRKPGKVVEQMHSWSSSRKIIRGSLESHSFTKIGQPIVKDFNYGLVLGTCNQLDKRFSTEVKGKQGLCMPIAAFCYSMLLHPSKWSELVVDDILEVGTKLCLDSMKLSGVSSLKLELELHQLVNHCIIEGQKIYFRVHKPDVVGNVRSTEKNVFNIYKGLQVFFARQRVGIVRSPGLNVLVWKDKHYYFFDAYGRKPDLYTCTGGRAILAYIYDLPELSTILLKHTVLDNHPFTISKISEVKLVENDDRGETDSDNFISDKSDDIRSNKPLVQVFLFWLICILLVF